MSNPFEDRVAVLTNSSRVQEAKALVKVLDTMESVIMWLECNPKCNGHFNPADAIKLTELILKELE